MLIFVMFGSAAHATCFMVDRHEMLYAYQRRAWCALLEYIHTVCSTAILFYEKERDANEQCADKLLEKMHQNTSWTSTSVTKRMKLPELILTVPVAFKTDQENVQDME